jgi:hypothetical protein
MFVQTENPTTLKRFLPDFLSSSTILQKEEKSRAKKPTISLCLVHTTPIPEK